jgi:putative DNA primase/helicase
VIDAAKIKAALDIDSPLAMALAYAAHGWPVFPLYSVRDGTCNCWRRADCGREAGKHPRTMDGFKSATTDPEPIKNWFDMWPESNIGIATGAVSGLVVVDIDPRNGGHDTVLALADEGKTFGRTAQVLTQSGGWHLYYMHPGGKVPCGSNVFGPGIDVRGDGGYVVAPPSVGVLGIYVWQVAPEELAAL